MQVERLRLAGFKSFVEPAELAIEPGLTGIVGPNGCGKSNLVEALRWVMGEASPKRLRGGEMDDVIFAGSGNRPARNLAEVALTIDNSAREAPFAYNESATIEVVRRIVRGGGSAFRINGREVRARDVQLLFADAATGPHSGALVGQGRIGALIAAKPTERRLLLDEAAGTAGLYARRHEAELKLAAAEDNLGRLDDVIAALATQIETLKKQARQAQRYRRLGEQIRRTEARLLYARWRAACSEAESFAAELRASERELAGATEAALAHQRTREAAETALPPLRMAQAAAAAGLQRITHAKEALEHELSRVVAARAEAARRLEQIAGDVAREAGHLADSETALARLADERGALERAGGAAETARAQAGARLAAAAAELATAETGLQQMTEACATGEARRGALERQRRDLAERQGRLKTRLAESENQREPLLRATVSPAAMADAGAAVAEAAAGIDSARAAAEAAAETLRAGQQREALAADAAREAERVLGRLHAEAEALTRVLAPGASEPTDRPSMLSLLQVPPGFEAAIAALFDGELAAPVLPSPAEPPVESTAEPPRRLPPAGSSWRRSPRSHCPMARVRWPARSPPRRLWRGASRGPAGSRARPTAGACSRCSRRARASSTATDICGGGTVSPGRHRVRRRPRNSCASATASPSSPRRPWRRPPNPAVPAKRRSPPGPSAMRQPAPSATPSPH